MLLDKMFPTEGLIGHVARLYDRSEVKMLHKSSYKRFSDFLLLYPSPVVITRLAVLSKAMDSYVISVPNDKNSGNE